MEKREKNFERNPYLEMFLKEINENLEFTEKELLNGQYEVRPVVLVMGALRAGTTLTTQWLANTGEFAYPTNLLSRFYNAPIIGAKIQRLLLDPKYNFRNEITDFSNEISYASQNGKTKGALSPNEFWYFWRRFFHYENLSVDYIPDEKLEPVFNKEVFVKELMGIAEVFQKPLAMKGMIVNYNIPFLDRMLDNVVFIHVKRDPCTNIASVLEARKRQLGDERKWYSFRIPQMQELLKLEDPAMQAAGQIYYINQAVEGGLQNVSEERKMEICYEDFCDNPKHYYQLLCEKLKKQGFQISDRYCGAERFQVSRKQTEERILQGYQKFMELI